MLNIYIDGSARNNGKYNATGGYGIVIFDNNNNLIDAYCKQFTNVTNNQMELKAFLKTFELLNTKYKNEIVNLYSDSAYCINMLTSWIYSWSQNNWKSSNKSTIKNLDIVLQLYEYYKIPFFINQINFIKVNGHTGIIGNELSDALAQFNKENFINIILTNHINIKIKEND